MHFAFVSMPGHGHVNPTLPLVQELVRRGHRVSYATNEKFRDAVESAGATLLPMPGEMPNRPPNMDPAELAEMMDRFIATAREGVAFLEEHLTGDRPDALCFDAMTMAGRFVAERMGLPDIALHPTYASNEQFSLRSELMANASTPLPPEYRQIFQRMREVHERLAADLGVKSANPLEGPPASLNIVFIPREFQFAGDTFDERFRFVGPSLGSRVVDPSWRRPDNAKPLLFISLGTAFNNQPEFFRNCLRAFGDGRWQVAMAVGEQVDPADLGPIPDNFEIRDYFPQPAVLQEADLFLSHTGMNSTMESLCSGVPIVGVPQQPEQEANARQVEQLGMGRRLASDGRSAEALRQAVDEVHADQQIRANVAEMSKTLRGTDGAVAAADAIEAHLAG
ncbi:glycosyl transferase [Saccharopolyspora sp. K220]|uniref:macrolide family glycosyltransferase n=1 Tax=Saccharopolyspora soli TaxID=2926618 RepID=UPI001F57914A|nr:macrolide family glycosyltransferase [Saccharopolyspora soli]MCI2422440.1 glycosyl transferase [Saccharopolyspora soli]